MSQHMAGSLDMVRDILGIHSCLNVSVSDLKDFRTDMEEKVKFAIYVHAVDLCRM